MSTQIYQEAVHPQLMMILKSPVNENWTENKQKPSFCMSLYKA